MNYTTIGPSDLTAVLSALVSALFCGVIMFW